MHEAPLPGHIVVLPSSARAYKLDPIIDIKNVNKKIFFFMISMFKMMNPFKHSILIAFTYLKILVPQNPIYLTMALFENFALCNPKYSIYNQKRKFKRVRNKENTKN